MLQAMCCPYTVCRVRLFCNLEPAAEKTLSPSVFKEVLESIKRD